MMDCECCCRKFTTAGCNTCITYNIKKIIKKLKYEIGHKTDIWNYKYFINKMYDKDILENVNLNRVDYTVTPKMEEDQIIIRVDKRAIDDYIKIAIELAEK